MKNQTSISLRAETKAKLKRLWDLSEDVYPGWDEFLNDLADVIIKDYNIKI